ncbi:unnamed protein product [Gongylonema pulchrum]|uniref:Uncharacterized protein n=1 Tax=Gongylonema pulchrum TaxID=637853 RepID=A0A3P7MSC4_9BILA|nr:unnamed protein product [Gongylonema pulchrum]
MHRMSCLFCFNTLCEAVGPENTVKELLPVVQQLSDDPVPNVRFNVAKTLLRIGRVIDQGVVNSQIKPLLMKMCNDSEFDVRYFADETRMALSVAT